MATGGIPVVVLEPGAIPAEEVYCRWREGLAPMMQASPLGDPRAPTTTPRFLQFHLGACLLMDTTFSRQTFRRDAEWGRQNDDADHVAVQIFQRGRNHVINGCSYVQEPGSVSLVNMGFEIEAVSEDSVVQSLILPRAWINDHIPGFGDLCGTLFPKGGLAAGIFTDFILGMRGRLDTAQHADAALLTDSMVGLLAPLVTHNDSNAAAARSGLFVAMRRHIDNALGDPNLGPESLCARFGCSRATLYRLFKDYGGVQAFILRRRLMACLTTISQPRNMHRQLYDIALDYGFTNASHFSKLFRAHFGMSPRETREITRAHAAAGTTVTLQDYGDPLDDVALMQRWAKTLGKSVAPL